MILIIIEIILGIILTAIFIQVSLKVKDLERKKRGEGFITIRDWIEPKRPITISQSFTLVLKNENDIDNAEELAKDKFIEALQKVDIVRQNIKFDYISETYKNLCSVTASMIIYPTDEAYLELLNTTNIEKPIVIKLESEVEK